MPLVNFQSLEMVIFDNFVKFDHYFWRADLLRTYSIIPKVLLCVCVSLSPSLHLPLNNGL